MLLKVSSKTVARFARILSNNLSRCIFSALIKKNGNDLCRSLFFIAALKITNAEPVTRQTHSCEVVKVQPALQYIHYVHNERIEFH